ncbi:carboxypeptidase-like regulatory domain-containing protein [Tellurirhabdus bombi]|uniref:carboxypeptidase-like regulatory domain-containing protein n=1 Tax=Tellurirhabdus bombi TaxID=2907205 RepID=UPI001F419E14|nr:carboxypeptidase-like regulatory domain-containing protein [Tellurirhabdus bombi]
MFHSPYVKQSLLYFLLFVLSNGLAIGQVVIRGKIQSVDDGRPVPYALITDPQHRFGTYADTSGQFTARVPAGVDTLLISCVGFLDTTVIISGLADKPVILLKAKETQLPEMIVRRRKPRIATLGALRRRTTYVWGNCSGRNIEYALLIRNPRSLNGYLNKIAYLIAREGIPTAPFRVRIYANNEGEPGADLLPRSVIATARRGGNWCEVDLSDYNIRLPKEGVFVAMEWLATQNPKYHFSKGFKMPDGQQNKLECYGQYLAFSKEIKSALVWERVNGGYWRRHSSTFSRAGGGEHPVIRTKVALGN